MPKGQAKNIFDSVNPTDIALTVLKRYFDENLVFPFDATLKDKQVVNMRRKMPFSMFELKITTTQKPSGWGVEKRDLPWEQNFYSRKCVSCRTISMVASALQIGQDSAFYLLGMIYFGGTEN